MKTGSSNNNIGSNIKQLRKNMGWSQQKTANQLKISISALSKIETGFTDINISRMQQLSSLFNISVEELITMDRKTYTQHKALLCQIATHQNQLRELLFKIIDLYQELSSLPH